MSSHLPANRRSPPSIPGHPYPTTLCRGPQDKAASLSEELCLLCTKLYSCKALKGLHCSVFHPCHPSFCPSLTAHEKEWREHPPPQCCVTHCHLDSGRAKALSFTENSSYCCHLISSCNCQMLSLGKTRKQASPFPTGSAPLPHPNMSTPTGLQVKPRTDTFLSWATSGPAPLLPQK